MVVVNDNSQITSNIENARARIATKHMQTLSIAAKWGN